MKTSTVMSQQFPTVPKDTVLQLGSNKYITKAGMYAASFSLSRSRPYRIEYDLGIETIEGHKFVRCSGELFLTNPTQIQERAMCILTSLIVNDKLTEHTIDIKEMCIDLIANEPAIKDEALIPILPEKKKVNDKIVIGEVTAEIIEVAYKKAITNCKMRLMSEYTGGGYGIPDDYTNEDVEDLPPVKQAAAIAAGLEELKEQDAAQHAEEPAALTKADYLSMTAQMTKGNLKLQDVKKAFMDALPLVNNEKVTKNSQLTEEQAKALYDAINSAIEGAGHA